MQKRIERLTPRELKEVARLRTKARKRARSLPKADPGVGDPVLRADDPDNPPLTDAQLRRMRPAYQVRPELVAAQLRRGPGRPKMEQPKQQVTLRIDRDVLDKFRATGEGWQSRINQALRKAKV
jgi:uncharacterized protein (DUF4415 family)